MYLDNVSVKEAIMMQRSWPSGHEHVILHHWVYYEIWLAAKKVIRGTGTKFDFTRGRKYSSELKTLWEMDDNEFENISYYRFYLSYLC